MTRRDANQVLSPALLVLAVVCLLAMPLDYRAGARAPHPHAALQLLAELATGTLHHHSGETGAHTVTEHAATMAAFTDVLNAGPGVVRSHAATTYTELERDLPHLGTASQTAKLSVVPLMASFGGLVLARRLIVTLVWFQSLPPQGLTLAPPAPPPRGVI